MTERILNERYRLDGPIGEGGTAIVYCGTDTLLRRRVAVKVLRSSFSADADFVERFYHEAQHAAKLSHPNIVSVYDVGHQDEAYFIVMELVEGATLDAVIRSKGRFPEAVAIDIATQICNGLSYAHRQGVLHRDIKAANVLMTNDDIAKISDFGIARAVAEQTVELTEAGTVVGSVSYISPEQAQGHELTPASDLYSLGIVLYQMLCGELPFTGPSAVSIALKHVSEPAPRIEALHPSISPVLASVVHRLLEKDPKARFSSAGELAAALREARERVTTVSDRTKMLRTEARTRAATPPPRRSTHLEQRPEPAGKSQDPSSPVRRFGSFTPAGLAGLLAIVFVIAVVIGTLVFHRGPNALFGPRAPADVIGMPVEQAEEALTRAGYSYMVALKNSDTVPRDVVIEQDPASTAPVPAHSAIHLIVSSGPELIGVVDLRAYSLDDAMRFVKNAGLVAKVVQRYDAAPQGTVIAQNPAPGAKVLSRSVVEITVSQGLEPVAVPSLISLTVDEARRRLAAKHLSLMIGERQATDAIPVDVVISQDPKADTQAPSRSSVTVVVSSGPVPATVPDVSSRNASDATAVLRAAGLHVHFNYVVQENGTPGTVIAQLPTAGSAVERFAVVTLTIQVSGSIPDVTGLSLIPARTALENSGYVIGTVTQEASATVAADTVVRTDPPAGTHVDPGATVNVFMNAAPAAGEPNAPLPNSQSTSAP